MLVALVSFGGCTARTLVGEEARKAESSATQEGFFFNYAHHGEDWHVGQCEALERQSPIDFSHKAPWDCQLGQDPPQTCDHGNLNYKYQMVDKIKLQNNGNSLAADFAGQGYGGITYRNKWFNLLSVNFHTLSEHSFNNRRYPLEVHFVHKQYDSGHIMVVAVPFDTPEARKAYEESQKAPSSFFLQRSKHHGWQQPPESQEADDGPVLDETGVLDNQEVADSNAVAFAIQDQARVASEQRVPLANDPGHNKDLQEFLQKGLPDTGKSLDYVFPSPIDLLNPFLLNGTFFEYRGSLTAPPCAEQATWMVRREPQMLSEAQWELIRTNIYKANSGYGNYRAIMPLMGRPIFVRTGVKGEPATKAEFPPSFQSNETRATGFGAIVDARWALARAKQGGKLAWDLDQGLAKASQAHVRELDPDSVFPMPTVGPPVMPPPAVPQAERLLKSIGDQVAKQVAGTMNNAVIAAAAAVPTVPPIAQMLGPR